MNCQEVMIIRNLFIRTLNVVEHIFHCTLSHIELEPNGNIFDTQLNFNHPFIMLKVTNSSKLATKDVCVCMLQTRLDSIHACTTFEVITHNYIYFLTDT